MDRHLRLELVQSRLYEPPLLIPGCQKDSLLFDIQGQLRGESVTCRRLASAIVRACIVRRVDRAVGRPDDAPLAWGRHGADSRVAGLECGRKGRKGSVGVRQVQHGRRRVERKVKVEVLRLAGGAIGRLFR
jgi:hypothetical protein